MPIYFTEIIVISLSIIMLVLDSFNVFKGKKSIEILGIAGLAITFLLLLKNKPSTDSESVFWNFYLINDHFSIFFKGVILLSTIIVMIMTLNYGCIILKKGPKRDLNSSSGLVEFFVIIMIICAGLMYMVSANNLVSIFVSIELVTISFYILSSYLRRDILSLESGLKYFILGAVSTCFLIYGFSWLYGITGSMKLDEIYSIISTKEVNIYALSFSFILIFIALLFKIGAVPFHFWIPDVYQGSPTPVTAFLSSASKAASFIVFMRLITPFLNKEVFDDNFNNILLIISSITVLFGSFTAIVQTNIKRLLAYSSISTIGFLLIVLVVSPDKIELTKKLNSTAIISFYLISYILSSLLIFFVMSIVEKEYKSHDIHKYFGLSKRSPILAFSILVAMISFAGIPLTSGFFSKYFIINLVIKNENWPLLTILLIGTFTGLYYYFKIITAMYFKNNNKNNEIINISILNKIVLIFLILSIFYIGINPNVIISLLT